MIKRLSTFAILALILAFTGSALAQVNVKFQIDMGVQMQLKTFDPATDSVLIRGDFQIMAGDTVTWGGTKFVMNKSTNNDSIYTLTVPFADSAKGKTIGFKYVIRHKGSDTWENTNNKTYTITTSANQVIPLVYFNNRTTIGITVTVTFEADMSSLLGLGFNPSTDSMEVRGGTAPLNWGPGILMSQNLLDPTIFKVAVKFTGVPGAAIQWKFHADPSSNFANGGWENISNNRIVIFPKADTTVGPIKPVILLGGKTTAVDTVTFTVNMNGAHEKYHHTLITGLKSVWIAGSVPPLTWPTNWLFSDTVSGGALIRMYDNGTHGDAKANDGIFSNILIFPSSSTTPVYFKYGAVFDKVDTLNGGASYLDNEAPFAANHTLVLILNGGKMTEANKFGDQITGVEEQPTGNLPTSYTLSQNYPNPFNPSTSIDYSLPKSGLVTLKVYNVLGEEVATIFQGFQNAGHYVASFDASKLASGIYLYRLQVGKFSVTKKMLLLK
ncbi:MAG TPA: T9SS type A sorting domain-containing protein [Ignavibacteria bacterium]|nr:T9SS type A sorting domain-containing protein [Ignavibacteria bacterium]